MVRNVRRCRRRWLFGSRDPRNEMGYARLRYVGPDDATRAEFAVFIRLPKLKFTVSAVRPVRNPFPSSTIRCLYQTEVTLRLQGLRYCLYIYTFRRRIKAAARISDDRGPFPGPSTDSNLIEFVRLCSLRVHS